MGLFDRVERKLDRVINGAFARAFRAEVQPVEIAAAMRRAMDDRAAVVGKGRTIVPNVFTIELDPTDYDRLTQYSDVLSQELIASVEEHADSQRYQPGGGFHVDFVKKDDLDTGVFRVRPATSKTAQRRGDHRGDPGRPPERPRHEPAADHLPFRHSGHPEASQQADGAVGLAGHAASAAAGAAAGTAAAGRAGQYWSPPDARDRANERDLAAWHDDSGQDDAPATRATPVPSSPPPELRPDPSQRPWIDLDGDTYPLLGAITVLGRDASADITLDDPGISRRHAEIRVTHDGPHMVVGLRDLGSTNGTYVNGETITAPHALHDGTQLRIGTTVLELRR